MLAGCANALDRPIGWFFEGNQAEPGKAANGGLDVGDRQRLTYELTSNFDRIVDENPRQCFAAVVRLMADPERPQRN